MNELIKNETKTITSLEVAEMLETPHKEILKKLEGTTRSDGSVKQIGIIPVLNKGNFPLVDYFVKSSYIDAKGEERKCYLITKLGCDFLANKFTGEKGILFTAKYVKRFSEMETALQMTPKAMLLLSIYNGGQDAISASKKLTEIEVQEATKPLLDENKRMKPKEKFHDAIAVSDDCVNFGDFAAVFQNNSDISFGRNKIMDWCRGKGYLCSSNGLKNKPSQQMIDAGYMQYHENVNERNGKNTLHTLLFYLVRDKFG